MNWRPCESRASQSGRWPAGFGAAAPPFADACPRCWPTARPTRTVKPERRPPKPSGPGRGRARSVSLPAIDRLLPPDLQSRPLVADWPIETTLEGLRAEWATIEKASALPPPRVHPAWVMTKLERLDALLRQDPQRAKVEILKHLDGDLVIVPRPSITGERRAEISGRARSDSLLRDQEAVCLQVVAGARNHPNRLAFEVDVVRV